MHILLAMSSSQCYHGCVFESQDIMVGVLEIGWGWMGHMKWNTKRTFWSLLLCSYRSRGGGGGNYLLIGSALKIYIWSNAENFLGEATVYFEDIKRNASSRQIIPLQGVTDDGTMASGSITVEVGLVHFTSIYLVFTCAF